MNNKWGAVSVVGKLLSGCQLISFTIHRRTIRHSFCVGFLIYNFWENFYVNFGEWFVTQTLCVVELIIGFSLLVLRGLVYERFVINHHSVV